jgi:hypothetical protein
MSIGSALVAALGLGAPVAGVVPVSEPVSVAPSRATASPDRSPGNARMTDGLGEQVQALEIEATLSPSVLFADAANPSYQRSYSNWGVAATGSFTYRARYFLSPSIEVGYARLARGDSALPDGPWGSGGTMEQQLSCWTISPGVHFPFWRFRLLAGIGLAIAEQENEFLGETNSVSQIGIYNRLGLSFDAVKTDRVRLAGVVQYGSSSGLKLSFLTFGVSFRGDIVQWD